VAVLVWAIAVPLAASPLDPPEPQPKPTATAEPKPIATAEPQAKPPSPSPRRLRLDLDRLAEEALEGSTPQFEESVDVEGQSPEAMLERHYKGLHLECEPAGVAAAPTEAESRAVRPHPAPYIDFIPLVKALGKKLKKRQPDRYFLYRIRSPERTTLVVRPERVPDSILQATPGTSYELVRGFSDLEDATRALHRLERGFDTAVSRTPDLPPQPWTTAAPCRPE
jgi:hypothetical protein